jgi:hypothetical protein
LKASTDFWDLKEYVPVATVFWNGSAGAVIKETHNHVRDLDWHINAHLTIGTRYYSGLNHVYPTADIEGRLEISAGYIFDEDIEHTISETINTARVLYQVSAGVYTWVNTTLPYAGTTDAPKFLDTDTYALSTLSATDYVNTWVYAVGDNDTTRQIYLIPTHRATAFNTIAQARAETPPVLTSLNINAEMKLIYKWTHDGDGDFIEVLDYRTSSSLPGGGAAAVTAIAVTFTPEGDLESTNVQNALAELDTEKAPIIAPTFTGTVTADGWALKDEGGDYTYNIQGSTLAADRTCVLPVLTDTDTFVFEAHIQTLTNKRIALRQTSETSSATPTIDTDAADVHVVSALAAAITSFTTNLSGTPTDKQCLQVWIKDDGTARAIAWGASFQSFLSSLPTTTVLGKWLVVSLQWLAADSKWCCMDSYSQA